jgi:hypothetical protein
MSEDLSIQGSLEETTVPDLFRSLLRSRETAIISLEAASRHDTIFFEAGAIVSAGSSDPDLEIATVLLRTGELSLRQFNEANEQMSSAKTMSVVLCEMGFLTPDELAFAQERKIANIVNDALRFRSGSYAIDFVPELPMEVLRHRLETERLLMNGVEQIESWALIGRGIGRMNEVLRQSAGSDTRIFALEVTEEEMHLYSILSEPQSVEMLCERSYLSNFETCRTVWALWTVNLVEHAEATEVVQTRSDTLEELELQSRVEQYNDVFQSLFALVSAEVGDYVWDFMDRVIRHLAPDRLPYLSGISLTNEARVDFDQLHNNLISSGIEDRTTVAHEVLNQLLYGWIVETRQEFGPRLQASVDEMVRPLVEDHR